MSKRDDEVRATRGHTRRSFFRMGAKAATAALLTAGSARAANGVANAPSPDALQENTRDFPLGIASGDVTPTSAVLWTRYRGRHPVELLVWQAGDPERRPVVRHVCHPHEGFIHVNVSNLRASERYAYAFFEMRGDAPIGRSAVGQFRVAFPEDARVPVMVGATACTRNGWDLSVLDAAGEREDFDVFIHLGDTVYCDGAETLSDYRNKWTENFSTTGYRRIRANSSVLATWDDHEVVNDWLPEDTSFEMVKNARRAFFEHQPLVKNPSHPDQIWRKRSWGKTLDVFILDCRSERRRAGCEIPEYISREQMEWLKRSLKESEATFKLLVNSVPISQFPEIFMFNRTERWEFYPEARTEILSFVDDSAIGGVMWLAGDFHLGSVGRVAPEGPGSKSLEVLAGPGGQFPNLRTAFLRKPQFDWASGENNYTTLYFDPDKGTVEVIHINKAGREIQRSVHHIA